MTARLETLPVEHLVGLRRNPQYLTPHQMDALKESIRRDGFLAPVLVRPLGRKRDRFEVVSGNHRVMAARELGLEAVPCVVAKMDDQTAQRVAVNLNTVHGDPTPELLAPFLAEMDDAVLASVHLPDELIKELVAFDEQMAARLAELEPPAAYNQNSPSAPLPDCVCQTCGKKHASVRQD